MKKIKGIKLTILERFIGGSLMVSVAAIIFIFPLTVIYLSIINTSILNTIIIGFVYIIGLFGSYTAVKEYY